MLFITCLLFSLAYVLFLYASITFADAATPVDMRLLSPVLLILMIGLFGMVWSISQIRKKAGVWYAFLLVVALSTLAKAPSALHSAAAIQKDGLGYTSRTWQASESKAYIDSLEKDTKIYTNGWDVFGFLTGKEFTPIPQKISSVTLEENPHYQDEMEILCTDVLERGALLVYSDWIAWRWYLPTQAEIGQACQLPILRHLSDGTVFGEKEQ